MDIRKAEELLEELSKIDDIIADRVESIEKLRASLDGTTTTFQVDRVQVTQDYDKRGRQLAELVDFEREMAEEISMLYRKKQSLIKELEKLGHYEYAVLYKRYVQGKDYYSIADELNHSLSWAKWIHSKAKRSLQDLLDAHES